jgi:hypothetical protein
MKKFLDTGIEMMRSEETKALLKGKSIAQPGQKLIQLQRSGWDALGIDQDVGCTYLEKIETVCPGDKELVGLRQEFVMQAQRSFVQALVDRKPGTLERKKKMPRETIIMFFDACNTECDLPETAVRLKKHLEETGKPPNTVIIDMQKDMLEVLGYEREHGCAMLSNITKDFPNDKELHARFEGWRQKATQTCMSVMKAHQIMNGTMPTNPFGDNPELQKLQAKAKEEIEAMSPQERGKLLEKMQKKVQVFAKLPPEGRVKHMQKLPEEERLEFVKTQILLMSMMQQQFKAQNAAKAPSQQATMDMGGASASQTAEEKSAATAPEVASRAAAQAASAMSTTKDIAAPSQQEMM